MKKIKRVWQASVLYVKTSIFDFKWNRRLELALKEFTKEQLPFVKPLLQNQINQLKNSYPMGPTGLDLDMHVFTIAKAVCKRLLTLSSIVGLQPMSGPVGLVYTLTYEETGDSPDGVKSLRLNIIKQSVEAQSRKLNSTWTIEYATDMSALHQIDFQAEIVECVALEIFTEIVKEVINDLCNIATSTTPNPISLLDDANIILVEINKMCTGIAHKTRRGAGNFIIASPIVAARLSMLKHYTPVSTARFSVSPMLKVGNLFQTEEYQGIPVYSSTCISDDVILVGYKGLSGEIDTGYIYSPYVILMPTGTVINPETFSPMIGLITRHGKTCMDNGGDYYGIIKLDSLGTTQVDQ